MSNVFFSLARGFKIDEQKVPFDSCAVGSEQESSGRTRHPILTYSTVQSPWEVNWFAASQEIPRIFMEPEGSLPHS